MQYNIVVISNITLEPNFNTILNETLNASAHVIWVDYDEFLAGNSNLSITECHLILVIPNFADRYHDFVSELNGKYIDDILNRELSNMQRIYSYIRSVVSSPFIWCSYEDYCFESSYIVGNVKILNCLVDRLNIYLFDNATRDTIFIDMKRLIASIGIDNAFDNKNKYRWNSPYSNILIKQLCSELHKQYLISNGITKKCLVLDCDNVLWGGTISEDGLENIKLSKNGLGKQYYDFQRYLLFLYYHGVILTICSKNDLSDIMYVFENHSEMPLSKEHISCFRANWNNKSENIKEISAILNIGLDSMVFVDDSDFEIESVKKILPEVISIKYNRDTIYSNLSCFNLKNEIDIKRIQQRNQTYATNQLRMELKENSKSFDEYIKSLDMKIDIHVAFSMEYTRIAELTQRANKCTNGIRYTFEQLKRDTDNPNFQLYSVSLSDKYSDLGLVGVFAVDNNVLQLFVLSCRALGRTIENTMIDYICGRFNINEVHFQNTGRNNEIKKMLENHFINANFK